MKLKILRTGVCSAGFKITVLPAHSAGDIFQTSIIIGKFQGIIWPHTPTGSILVYKKFSLESTKTN